MKRKLICTIFIMVAGLFWLHIVNAQDTIVMGNKDLEDKRFFNGESVLR